MAAPKRVISMAAPKKWVGLTAGQVTLKKRSQRGAAAGASGTRDEIAPHCRYSIRISV
jgi:hypothetical protein